MNKSGWLKRVKIIQAIGITFLGVFFIFNTSNYILLVGGVISILASLAEWLLTYFIQQRKLKPIPLVALFLKMTVIIALVFRGLFQNTDLSLTSFIVLLGAIALAMLFQLFMAIYTKRKRE